MYSTSKKLIDFYSISIIYGIYFDINENNNKIIIVCNKYI